MIQPYQKQDKTMLMQLLAANTPASFAPQEAVDFSTFLDGVEHYFVYRKDQEILACGGFALGDENAESACLCWDMVHPKHHGKGIGQKLVYHRMQLLREHPHISRVFVRTSQMAAQFYIKQGFKWKFTKKDFWAPGFDLYYLEQPLH